MPRALVLQISVHLAPYDDFDGLDDDRQIEERAMILHIEQVVLQFLGCILFGRTIWIAQLRPTCEPRLDGMPFTVVWNALVQLRNKFGRSGRGPTKLISPRNTLMICVVRRSESCE